MISSTRGLKRNLKRYLIVLLVACLPNAHVFSVYFGFRDIVFIGGLQIGLDLESPSSGPGMRLAYTTALLLANQFALDAYWRVPLNEAGTNAYAGIGAGWSFGPIYRELDLHALIGVDIWLGPSAGLYLELAPSYVLSGEHSPYWIGPPPPPDAPTRVRTDGRVFLLITVGVNFRV